MSGESPGSNPTWIAPRSAPLHDAKSPLEIQVGDQLPEIIRRPTSPQLFRYSAITWNAHRIHYDEAYAREEGYPGVLVQSHLHSAYLATLCTQWLGDPTGLRKLAVTIRRYAVAGDSLRCRGHVLRIDEEDEYRMLHVSLQEIRLSDGVVCASGTASLAHARK